MSTAYGSTGVGAIMGNNPSQWDSTGRVVGINGQDLSGIANKMLNNPALVNSRLNEIQRFNSMLGLSQGQQPGIGSQSGQDWLNSLVPQQTIQTPFANDTRQLNLGPNVRPMFQGFKPKE